MGRVKVSARASNTIQSASPPSTTFFLRYSRARYQLSILDLLVNKLRMFVA